MRLFLNTLWSIIAANLKPARDGFFSTFSFILRFWKILLNRKWASLKASLKLIQVFARVFIHWHPAHATTTSSTTCCTRPTSTLGKYLQGLHFFGRQAANPQEFVVAVQWWLGGTLKLGLVPALWLLIPEVFMRFWRIADFQKFDFLFLGHGSRVNSLATHSGIGHRISTLPSSSSLALPLQLQRNVVWKIIFNVGDGFIWSSVAFSVASSHGYTCSMKMKMVTSKS